MPFLTPSQSGAQLPGEAATPHSNMWVTAVKDPAVLSQMMDIPFTLPMLTFTVLTHVKGCEVCNRAVGRDNTAFLCHPGGLKELEQLAELVAALAPPSLQGRKASGFMEICLMLGLISGFITLLRVSSIKQFLGAGEKLRLLWTLSHGAFCLCSSLLCCYSNTR